LRDGANQKSPVFLTGFFLFIMLLSEKEFFLEDYMTAFQFEQTIPSQLEIVPQISQMVADIIGIISAKIRIICGKHHRRLRTFSTVRPFLF